MSNRSKLCDNECLNPVPNGKRRVVPIPESPFIDFTPPIDSPQFTTTTTTTTLYPENLIDKIIYPNEDVSCPIIYPSETVILPTDTFLVIGGIIRTYSYQGVSYRSHTFNSTSELNISNLSGDESAILSVDVLIVGGGGGGGLIAGGGGGGGGGFIENVSKLRSGNYLVIVGDGGNPDENGQNSSFNQLIAYGGGAGGSFGLPGRSGGSGGGAGQSSISNGGQGITGQGFSGAGVRIVGFSSGGGGGASEAARDIIQTYLSSNGGSGKFNTFMDGNTIYYSGGGGGGSENHNGQGGLGGGGSQIEGFDNDGQPNSGGGGAGSKNNTSKQAGKGGSGIVIVRYRI